MLTINNLHISWLGFSGIKIKTHREVIYIDPYAVYNTEPADIILITHEHASHLSNQDIERLAKEETVVVAPTYAHDQIFHPNKKVIAPGDTLEGDGIAITAVNAYELQRSYPHPRGRGVGYVIEINDTKLYHAGDTDFISDMIELTDLDVAFYPIGGFEDAVSQALEFINTVHPKYVIPIHYHPTKDRQKLVLFENKVVNSRVVLG